MIKHYPTINIPVHARNRNMATEKRWPNTKKGLVMGNMAILAPSGHNRDPKID